MPIIERKWFIGFLKTGIRTFPSRELLLDILKQGNLRNCANQRNSSGALIDRSGELQLQYSLVHEGSSPRSHVNLGFVFGEKNEK
jgi:hypothetical protein